MSENHHHQQSYGQNIVLPIPLSGSVRVREEDSANSSPEASRRRLLNGPAAEYEHPQVLCFAARNRRGRFYIPMTTNNFGGMPVNHVLFDSGCSSLLLPFPLQDGLPQPWLEEFYIWAVSPSRGTGAIHSPVLKIKPRIGPNFTCVLAGKVQPNLNMLRIHIGSRAANRLLNTQEYRSKLDEASINKLRDFLSEIGDHRTAPERTYALLGQSYMSHVTYVQSGDVAIAFSQEYDGTDNIRRVMARYTAKLEPLVGAFEGFYDLEDDDGDEDEEEYRLSWDISSEDDDVDELDDR
ncbi:hypothetical protein ACA910_020311 [Epithemia clementina (nom. ined.)]